jgi:hypothetical protein
MLKYYETVFGNKPKKYKTPLEPGEHPELDTSPLETEENTRIYLTLIGQLQWLVSLGRFDIASAVATLSSFRIAPRIGHYERTKRVYGYLSNTKHGAIRFRTGEPDYSNIPKQTFDWTRTVYGKFLEQTPTKAPPPLGKYVQTTTYVDANLMHCQVTGKSLTKQATVESATYGSEFVAARVAVDQIIDIRNTLRYLGVPIQSVSYLFGDNNSVVVNSTFPTSMIAKRHHLLSYHRVREAIAAGYIAFYWIESK